MTTAESDRSRPLAEIPTPALILDRGSLAVNCAAMLNRMKDFGVLLRPHMKTAKSVNVAEIACGGVKGPVTVSTTNEALWFAQHGFTDILYAVGFNPARLNDAIRIQDAGAALTLITDNLETVTQLSRESQALNREFPVLIEIDSGHGRGGVLAESDELITIARQLEQSAGTRLAGILTHAGHSYNCTTIAEVIAVAEEERFAAVTAASRLIDEGLPCPVVSVGSTPTAVHAKSLQGVTEMRPGVYQFGDLAQVCLGSCEVEKVALSVLTTVIGHNRQRGSILIDAGGLALSKDLSTKQYRNDWGYGLVCDIRGQLLTPRLSIEKLEQEHGFISARGRPELFDQLPLGTNLRILPNHACMTAAAYPGYWIVKGTSATAKAFWVRCNGWQNGAIAN